MNKLREVADTVIRRHVNIPYVQETKWKGEETKEVEDTNFKQWYTSMTATKNGVGIVMNKSLKDEVVDIKWQGDWIIFVKLHVGDLGLNVISAHTPQISPAESFKRQFLKELNVLVSSVPISKKLFIGYLNGHVDLLE
jgi:exonuclease III